MDADKLPGPTEAVAEIGWHFGGYAKNDVSEFGEKENGSPRELAVKGLNWFY